VTIIIAFLPSIREVGVKNSWLPEVIGTLGIITLFFAFIGFYGAFRLNTVAPRVRVRGLGVRLEHSGISG